ncbi:MAG TPA: MFS transporter [Caulobacteraceae bacterium]|nr:MFS transporter [Caulobacteraceae bacterium]
MADEAAPIPAPKTRREVFLYFGLLTFLVYLASPHSYLLDVASAYFLKNQLHATASQISMFRVLTAAPIYVSFLFGLTRDLWNPLRRRDRGFLLIFAPVAAAIFLEMAALGLSYTSLFVGMIMAMIAYRFIAAAYQGLMALTAQEQLMSGRLSALWQIISMVATFVAGVAGGWVVGKLTYAETFVLMAALTLLIGLIGLWKPRAVFERAYDRPQARSLDFLGDLKRLVNHRAVYPPVIIILLFQFSPGLNTPMQFYLSNTLHAPDAVYGEFNGLISASFIPAFILYGFLCRRFSLKTLLWAGSILTVPQMIPLAFIHSGNQALMLAVPMGLMGGIAVCAFADLTMRSCPDGLQGSLMMMVEGVGLLSLRASDWFGSAVYDANPQGGFLYCVIATTVVYAFLIPTLLMIPKRVIATREGAALAAAA